MEKITRFLINSAHYFPKQLPRKHDAAPPLLEREWGTTISTPAVISAANGAATVGVVIKQFNILIVLRTSPCALLFYGFLFPLFFLVKQHNNVY